MGFWVYILRCADNSYYIGHTDNIEKRIAEHQMGEIKGYTSTRLPVELVFSDEFSSREEALARERQMKGWSRKKKEAMIRGDWEEVSRLARGGYSSFVLRPSSFVLRPSSFDKLRTNGVEGCLKWRLKD